MITIHSKSIYGEKKVPKAVFDKLFKEGVIYLEEKPDSQKWYFKTYEQAINQRKRRKIFSNG